MSFAEDRIQYADVMELNPPAKKEKITEWERAHGWMIPAEYSSFLLESNGGEIYIPGTVLFGVDPAESWCSLAEHNQPEFRGNLPEEYLIIGVTNYGNPIGMYTGDDIDEDTCMVVEWDTEEQEACEYWDSLEDMFLTEREIYLESDE